MVLCIRVPLAASGIELGRIEQRFLRRWFSGWRSPLITPDRPWCGNLAG
ncbi:MAG: hypothetical protein WBA57_02335 [Elainellaceae cyanobacterium]